MSVQKFIQSKIDAWRNSLNDNRGFVQQGRLTTQPIQNFYQQQPVQAQQRYQAVSNAFKPVVPAIKSFAKPVISNIQQGKAPFQHYAPLINKPVQDFKAGFTNPYSNKLNQSFAKSAGQFVGGSPVEGIVPLAVGLGTIAKGVKNLKPTKLISKVDDVAKLVKGKGGVGKTYKIIKQEGIREVQGTPVKIIDGVDTFIHEGTGGWVVSEASTGRYLADSVSKEGAIAKAKFNINNVGVNKFKQLLSEKQLPKLPPQLDNLVSEARKYKSAEEFNQALRSNPEVMWHGSPTGQMRGGKQGLHIGTYRAAQEALNARIGIRADGKAWDGTSEYGKTLLAGSKTQARLAKKGILTGTGFNAGVDFPNYQFPVEDFYPSKAYGWKDIGFSLKDKPTIQPVKIKGQMSNSPQAPMSDFQAGGRMAGLIKRGKARSGYFYENVGEDVGSISAVVPNKEYLDQLTDIYNQANKGEKKMAKLVDNRQFLKQTKKLGIPDEVVKSVKMKIKDKSVPLKITPPPSDIPPMDEIDPVQKIIKALKTAKPLRGKQEALYTAERGKRIGQAQAVGQNVAGEKGYFAQLSKLKGALPKVKFETIRGQVGQQDVDGLFNQIRDNKYITEWEKVSAQGELSKLLGAEGGELPTESGLKLLDEVFGKEFTEAVLEKRSFGAKALDVIGNVLNVPRTLMASVDVSAPLRQGWGLMGKPKEFTSAFGKMFHYLGSSKGYQEALTTIKNDANYLKMREGGLSISKEGPLLLQREERFMSSYAEKIPGVGSLVKASGRAYTGFLNKLRSDTFNTMLKDAVAQGLPDGPDTYKAIAKFINIATGRGSLGELNKASLVLSNVMFSPRLLASRIQMMNPATYITLPAGVRKQAVSTILKAAGIALTITTLAKMGGAEVVNDSRNADFGKIKVGNTRYDMWAGFQQPIRALSQIISGKIISSTTGKEMTLGEGYKPMTRLDVAWRFFQSKESPVASFVQGLLSGQDFFGQPFQAGREAIDRMIPMVIQDMYDLYKERGIEGIPMAVPALFGVGVQTYGKQYPTIETTDAGNPVVRLKNETGLGEDIYNKLTGTPKSNIPEDQWASIVSAKQNESMNAYNKAQAKKKLQGLSPEAQATIGAKASDVFGSTQSQPSYISVVVNGETKIIDTNFQPQEPELTGNTELDKKAISDYKGQITQKKNDIYDLYQAGKLTADEAEQQLQELKNLSAQAGGGKAKKPKKLTAAKISAVKPSRAKIARGKRAALKTQKLSVKMPKVKRTKFKVKRGAEFKLPPLPKLKPLE